jgi:hypothetical protein
MAANKPKSSTPVGATPTVEKCTVNIADIVRLPELHARVKIDQGKVGLYAKQKGDGHNFPVIEIYEVDGKLVLTHGWHRDAADRQNGTKIVDAVIYRGRTMSEARLAAAQADAYGSIKRTTADKHKAVRILLDDPEWANRTSNWIAEAVNIDRKTVEKIIKARSVVSGNPDTKRVGRAGGRHQIKGETRTYTGKRGASKPKPSTSSAVATAAALGPVLFAPSDSEPSHHDEQQIRNTPVGTEKLLTELDAEELNTPAPQRVAKSFTLTDTLDVVLHDLVQDPEFIRYLSGVDNATSVEGLLADDNVILAARVRDYGALIGIPMLAQAKTPEIRRSLNAALKRHEPELPTEPIGPESTKLIPSGQGAAASAVASFQSMAQNFRRIGAQEFVDANRTADQPATAEDLRHWAARMVDAANIMDIENTGTTEPLRTLLGEAYRVTARAIAAADNLGNWPSLSNAAKGRVKKAISALKAHDFLTLRNEYDEAQARADKEVARVAKGEKN